MSCQQHKYYKAVLPARIVIYCKNCGVEFVPKSDISQGEFDAAFEHYFKALDELLKVKKEKTR